jgi:hypothetical protein
MSTRRDAGRTREADASWGRSLLVHLDERRDDRDRKTQEPLGWQRRRKQARERFAARVFEQQ